MRLGLSSSLEHEDASDWARRMHAIGCGSVVFPVDYTAGDEAIDAYVAAARQYDLVIAEVGAWCSPIAGDLVRREQALERCKGQLLLADRIGAGCCVNVAGATGDRWDGPAKDNFTQEVWDLTVSSIQEIIDEVEPVHTCYTIEPMPWMYPTGPDEYLRLIEAVDREHFAVHLDIFNWINSLDRYYHHMEFMEECFEKLGPYIKSMHLKDVHLGEEFTLRFEEVRCGAGEINLGRYIELADSLSLDMPMIIEHLHTDQEYLESLRWVQAEYGQKKRT